MPKLIDYPRTNYTGAWEVAEIVDDTGGKCALETSARKLNRKVSGSFKAIVGSAVKFGLLTSKREILTTTTLFRRIKHAYDKQEELLFHREAFLSPPLFTQLCRKFRGRELPVAMLDVLLIREFDVEEINAQSVAKSFTDGARMVGLLNEDNVVADIDQLAAQQPARREIASPTPSPNVFRQSPVPAIPATDPDDEPTDCIETSSTPEIRGAATPVADTSDVNSTKASAKITTLTALLPPRPAPFATTDAIASLFGLEGPQKSSASALKTVPDATISSDTKTNPSRNSTHPGSSEPISTPSRTFAPVSSESEANQLLFHIQLAGPGLNTQLEVADVEDLALVRALLDKIERRLKQ